jgi:hypothetical protein
LRALRMRGHSDVVAWKATGTGSVAELARYLDFGAAAFDCVDFGLPSTYPLGRSDIGHISIAHSISVCRGRLTPSSSSLEAIYLVTTQSCSSG